MNNLQDVRTKVYEELQRTFKDRSMTLGSGWYLWYVETSESAPGNIMVAQEQPQLGWMIADRIRGDLTDEQNVNDLTNRRILGTLPILDVEF